MILTAILLINIIWLLSWYLLKYSKTLPFRVKLFIWRYNVKPKLGKPLQIVSFDALKQLFLRHSNEDIRDFLRSSYQEEVLATLFDTHLEKNKDGKYLINDNAKFRNVPTAPLITEEDNLQIL